MMTPATEIATIPLVAGTNIKDQSSEAGKVWQNTLHIISQQDGFQQLSWGFELENDSVVQLLIDWESHEHHQKFIGSPIYEPFKKHLMAIVDAALGMVHVRFTPHPPSAAVSGSPITEICTCYFEGFEPAYEDRARKLFRAFEKAPGFKSAAGGWVIEDVEHEKLGSGKKGKAFVGLLGWESKEAHMRCRASNIFQENIHLLREGPVALEMHHTNFGEA